MWIVMLVLSVFVMIGSYLNVCTFRLLNDKPSVVCHGMVFVGSVGLFTMSIQELF